MITMILQMKKKKMGEKYNPKSLLLKGQKFTELKKDEKSKSQPEEIIAERVKLKNKKQMIQTYFTHHPLLLMMNLLIIQICHH